MKTVLNKKYVLFAGVILLVAGCASTGTIQQTAPITVKLSGYKTMLFRVSSDVPESSQEVVHFESMTVAKLRERGLFEKVIAGSASPNAKADLRADAEIVKLKKVGSGARVMLGAFAGRAGMAVEVKLTDVKTGKNLGVFKAEGKSSGGTVFAGNTGQAVERIAEQIVEFVQNNM